MSDDNYEPSDQIKLLASTHYTEFKKLATSINMNVDNIIVVVTRCMETAETFTKLSGQDKYDFVILIMNQVIDDVSTSDKMDMNDREYMKIVVPSLIKIIIDASKGKLNLQDVKHMKNRISITQIVDDLYSQLKGLITGDKNYTPEYICSNIIIIVGMLMSAVEEYSDLNGIEKKAIVIRVINKLVEELESIFPDMSPELMILVKSATSLIPNAIDVIISVARHHFDINAIKAKCFSCCKKSSKK